MPGHHRLVGISVAIFAHLPVNLLRRGGRRGVAAVLAEALGAQLTKRQVLSSVGRIERPVGQVLPVAQVDDRNHRPAHRVGEDGVGRVLARGQRKSDRAAVGLLPLGHGVQEELLKGEGTGVLES